MARLPATQVLGHHANSVGHCLMLSEAVAGFLTLGDWLDVQWTPDWTARYLVLAVEKHGPVRSVLVERH